MRCKDELVVDGMHTYCKRHACPKPTQAYLKQTLFIIIIHLKEPTQKRGSSMWVKRLFMHACFQGGKHLYLPIYIWMAPMYDYSTHCSFLVDYGYANLIRDIKFSFKCYWWMKWWNTNWSRTIVDKEIITWMVVRIWDVKRKFRGN